MESARREQLRAISFAFLSIVWIVVPLRLFVRRFTQILYTGFTINTEIGIEFGTGAHRAELTEWQWHSALKSAYTAEVFYVICACLLKISFGFFLLRIATGPKMIVAIKALMIGTGSFSFVYLLLAIFQCRPVNAWWDDNPRSDGRCTPSNVVLIMAYLASGINCFADFSFAFLPVLIVRPLSMSTQRKILVVMLMGMGAVGSSRIVLTVFTVECSGSSVTIVRATMVPGLLDGEEFLYTNVDFEMWSTVEVGTGMTASSLACLRPLIQKFRYMWGDSDQGPSSRWWQLRVNRRRQRTCRDVRPAAQDGIEAGTWGYNDHSAINSALVSPVEVRGRGPGGNARGGHGGERMWLQKLLQISAITTSTILSFTRRSREGQNCDRDSISLAENGMAATAGVEEDARPVLDEHLGVQSLPRISQQDSAVQIPIEDSVSLSLWFSGPPVRQENKKKTKRSKKGGKADPLVLHALRIQGLYERIQRRPSQPRSRCPISARTSTREATSNYLPVMDPRALTAAWQSEWQWWWCLLLPSLGRREVGLVAPRARDI
ncbi:hypothetical protein PspLS_02818 [Pyricularia sp. CBS 133598]|nr:hypothetical protein PspLS_02818 [Pyricularia sp. CBS 133598]